MVFGRGAPRGLRFLLPSGRTCVGCVLRGSAVVFFDESLRGCRTLSHAILGMRASTFAAARKVGGILRCIAPQDGIYKAYAPRVHVARLGDAPSPAPIS
jgi:hypothetical protein